METTPLTGKIENTGKTIHAVSDGNARYSYATETDNRKWLVTLSNGRTARFTTRKAAESWLDCQIVLAAKEG